MTYIICINLMKRIVIEIGLGILIIALFLFMAKTIRDLNTRLSYSVNNEKAYAAENSELNVKNREFQLTISQLKSSNDSLMIKMKEVANENGIKDKKIKSLQYQLESFNKKDTIVLKDTIFRDHDFVLDTCIMDQWNKSCIHMEYPNIIALDQEYNNSKYILANTKREPIKPRKWFLSRWFTKKHTVIEITVVDENPYVTTKEQRFVQIVND